ncbi:hypothetical protein LCGC14_0575790 [marine sediment metagenome]|uniref:Uncharacterized protein n=1 Tax=marine sediment metagenome TaxID=412755 RepID=A0A0F9U469_9ZZZZ
MARDEQTRTADPAQETEASDLEQDFIDEMRRRYDAPDGEWQTLEEFEQRWKI